MTATSRAMTTVKNFRIAVSSCVACVRVGRLHPAPHQRCGARRCCALTLPCGAAAVERHPTLRAAMDWSCDLLGNPDHLPSGNHQRPTALEEQMSAFSVRCVRCLSARCVRSKRCESITIRDTKTDTYETLETAGLFVLIGSQPRTEWLPSAVKRDEWGFILPGREAGTDPAVGASSSLRGVLRCGRRSPRIDQRVASAVGEGALVIDQLHQYLADLDHR